MASDMLATGQAELLRSDYGKWSSTLEQERSMYEDTYEDLKTRQPAMM